MSVLAHKIVWITGASSGIGEAIALEVSRMARPDHPVKLVLSARRTDELERVARQTGLPATDVLVLPVDVTAFDQFPALVERVRQHFGRIDFLYLNAGISQRSTVVDTDLSVYQRLMDVNFFGTIALTKAVLPIMLAQGSGHLVVTSSVAGKLGTKYRSGYCASKHALHGFFDALRAEVHRAGLHITMVCPGYIRTPLSLQALNATGHLHGKMDTNQQEGMTPDVFARRLLKAVARQKEEVYIGGRETVGIYLKRFLPGLLSRIVRNREGP